jgi:hypothetical protein
LKRRKKQIKKNKTKTKQKQIMMFLSRHRTGQKVTEREREKN